jgi:hypothetical protein
MAHTLRWNALKISRDETYYPSIRQAVLVSLKSFPSQYDVCPILVLRGSAEILQQTHLLECLAESCSQAGAMHWLPHFLAAHSMMKKEPYLVLLLQVGADCERFQAEDVWGAVIMFEYRLWGLPTRAFSTDDVTGFRTVVAPEEQRSMAAALAAGAIVERGGQYVLVSHEQGRSSTVEPRLEATRPTQWARRRRPVLKALPLGETYEATLASLGKSTRFNLRYYRKRLLEKMPLEFVADARGLLTDSALQALNLGSLNPLARDLFRLQYKSASTLPGGYVVGLRGADGRWLSMVGGWRQGNVTVLYWQMNAAGFEKDSLGTVMRSYLLEHEVENGAQTLIVYGGTQHSMGNSFVREDVTDLVVRQTSIGAAMLRMLARAACVVDQLLGRQKNFLARLIGEEHLEWHPAKQSTVRRSVVALGPAK